jgi:peptide/nickel transport system substrate-binding protein
LRILSAGDIDSLDPGAMYSPVSWFLARGVFRTLTTYPADLSGGEPADLVGDLATDTGTPNEDATEWMFTLRDGIRYGPALNGSEPVGVTGAEIVCDDIKYAFERQFMASVEAGYSFYYDILEGSSAFERGESEEIDGVECIGDKSIVFRLTEPAADWPHRVSLPATAPVPRSLASGYDDDATSDYGMHSVSSGPYYLTGWVPQNSISLKRNPYWDPKTDSVRSALVDEVVWKQGYANDEGVERVMRDEFDLALDVSPHGALLERVVTDPNVGPRLVNESLGCTRYLFLNTTVEPFNDPLVRQAVNLAIDKVNLKRIYGGPVTGPVAASVIPPGIEGYLPPEDYAPFATFDDAGNMQRARKLLAQAGYPDGYDGPIKVVGPKGEPISRVYESVVRDLRRLGFSGMELLQPNYANEYSRFYERPSSNTAIGTSAGWCKDYMRAYSMVNPVLSGDEITALGNRNFAELDDPRLNAAIDSAQRELDPIRAEELWQNVNRIATESGAWVPWSWDESAILYSSRLVGPRFLSAISQIDWVNVGLTISS